MRHIGVSNFNSALMAEAARLSDIPLVTNQFEYPPYLNRSLLIDATHRAGLGVTAFVFEVTRPKLLQLAWFRTLYDLVMRALAWAHAMVEPVRRRLRKYIYVLRPRNAGRFYRHLMRVRRTMQRPAAAAS